jgi:hypothetical protein
MNKYFIHGHTPSPAHAELPWSMGVNVILVESLRHDSLNDSPWGISADFRYQSGVESGVDWPQKKTRVVFQQVASMALAWPRRWSVDIAAFAKPWNCGMPDCNFGRSNPSLVLDPRC